MRMLLLLLLYLRKVAKEDEASQDDVSVVDLALQDLLETAGEHVRLAAVNVCFLR